MGSTITYGLEGMLEEGSSDWDIGTLTEGD
jgi:hypothetical protein